MNVTKGLSLCHTLRLEREISDRRNAGGLVYARNAEDDVLAALAVESHEPHNVATVGMAVANTDRHVAAMPGDDVIKQRNRAGMQSQRIFNRLCKLDHVPSHGIAHSAGKPNHMVVIVPLDACRETFRIPRGQKVANMSTVTILVAAKSSLNWAIWTIFKA